MVDINKRLALLSSFLLLLFQAIYAWTSPDYLQMVPGIFIFLIYIVTGYFWRYSSSQKFTGFCLGEGAAVALWLIAPIPGVITAIFVAAWYLHDSGLMKTSNDHLFLTLWGAGTVIIAIITGSIQSTLLPCMAILFITGIVILVLLLVEYRMIYHAGESKT